MKEDGDAMEGRRGGGGGGGGMDAFEEDEVEGRR